MANDLWKLYRESAMVLGDEELSMARKEFKLISYIYEGAGLPLSEEVVREMAAYRSRLKRSEPSDIAEPKQVLVKRLANIAESTMRYVESEKGAQQYIEDAINDGTPVADYLSHALNVKRTRFETLGGFSRLDTKDIELLEQIRRGETGEMPILDTEPMDKDEEESLFKHFIGTLPETSKKDQGAIDLGEEDPKKVKKEK